MNPNSILATLTEIEVNPFRALFDERQEALEIIERIEMRLACPPLILKEENSDVLFHGGRTA